MAAPTLSILVPTYAREHDVTRLVRALAAEHPVPVVVSDNASPDTTAAALRVLTAQMPGLHVHVQERNLGAEANYAWLIDHAPATDYVWLLGDDDLPVPGAVAEVLALLERTRPALLHLPHTFEGDGQVHARSPCPPQVDVLASSRELMLAYTRWPSFISSVVVERSALAATMRAMPTTSRFAPYIWFMNAARGRRCAVAARPLVTGGVEATWSDARAEVLTDSTIEAFDEGLHHVLSAEEFGRVLDGFYPGRDCFDCWQARPLEHLMGAVERFPSSRQLRRFLWDLGRGREDALAVLDAVADEALATRLVAEGERRFAAGDVGGAVQSFRAAADERPTWVTAWNDLGVALHALGQPSARDAFGIALSLDPSDEDARYNLARL